MEWNEYAAKAGEDAHSTFRGRRAPPSRPAPDGAWRRLRTPRAQPQYAVTNHDADPWWRDPIASADS